MILESTGLLNLLLFETTQSDGISTTQPTSLHQATAIKSLQCAQYPIQEKYLLQEKQSMHI